MVRPSKPRRAFRGRGWVESPDLVPLFLVADGWSRKGLVVFSSLGAMEAPDGSGDVLPTWLVSVSRRGRSTPLYRDLERVRRDFGMTEAEEDNHEPGNARKLFLVVDPARRVACECKTTERTIVREDGYRYTVPIEEGA